MAHLGYFDFHDLFAVIAELEMILAANGHAGAVRKRRGGGTERYMPKSALPKAGTGAEQLNRHENSCCGAAGAGGDRVVARPSRAGKL